MIPLLLSVQEHSGSNGCVFLKLREAKEYVPGYGLGGPYVKYLIMIDSKNEKGNANALVEVGSINITLVTEEQVPSIMFDGHIGIFIKPEYRGNGYAKTAISILVPFTRDRLSLSPIYICCEPDNLASFKTIGNAAKELEPKGQFLGNLKVPEHLDLFVEEKIPLVSSFRF